MVTETLGDSNYLNDDFQAWVEGLLDKHHVPGISIAVIDGDRVEATGYGLACLPDIPATADTVYTMASTTKAFTAAAMGMIIHDNDKTSKPASEKLSWSTPVSKILPDDFILTDPYITQNATIEDLLSHRSALPGHDVMAGPWMGRSAEAFTQRLRHLGPMTEPFRVKLLYNNIMYAVVTQVAEKLEGKDFATIVQERIFTPLGMEHSFWGIDLASKAVQTGPAKDLTFARGYYWVKEDSNESDSGDTSSSKGYYVPMPYSDIVGDVAAGGNHSTVSDYAKWVTAWLEAAKPPDRAKGKSGGEPKSIISNKLFTEATSPRIAALPPMTFFPDINPLPSNPQLTAITYGLGWQMDCMTFPGHAIVQHSGGMPGFGTLVTMLPNEGFGVVIATNHLTSGNKVCEIVNRDLIGCKLGTSKAERRKDSKDKQDDPGKDINKSKEEEGKVKETPLHDVPANAPTVDSDTRNPPKTNVSTNLQDFIGTYIHPAYGSFSVKVNDSASLASLKPTADGHRIIRKQKKEEKEKKDQSKPTKSALQADAIGRRSLRYTFILHPRETQSVPYSQQKKQYHFFDMEKLAAQGNMEDEPFPGFDLGYGREDDEKYPCKKEMLWENQEGTTHFGGVFETVCDDSSHEKVLRMGLQLFRRDFPGAKEESKPEEGWEKLKIWFEKVDCR